MRKLVAFVCSISPVHSAGADGVSVTGGVWEREEGLLWGLQGWWGKGFASEVLCPTHAPSAASAPTPASFVMLIKATGTVFCSSQRTRERKRTSTEGWSRSLWPIVFSSVTSQGARNKNESASAEFLTSRRERAEVVTTLPPFTFAGTGLMHARLCNF